MVGGATKVMGVSAKVGLQEESDYITCCVPMTTDRLLATDQTRKDNGQNTPNKMPADSGCWLPYLDIDIFMNSNTLPPQNLP